MTPDTSSYMLLGFGFFFVSMGIYLASLFVRERNLRRDFETLEALQETEA